MKLNSQRIPTQLNTIAQSVIGGVQTGISVTYNTVTKLFDFVVNSASTTQAGIVMLSNLYNGSLSTKAATEKALSEGLATKTAFSLSQARAAISEDIDGITYDDITGVLSMSTGYAIPTEASQVNWDTAYNWGNHASAGYCKWLGVLTADPTGENGAMYYNSNTSKVRQYNGSTWLDLN